jgi:hypothetical protein
MKTSNTKKPPLNYKWLKEGERTNPQTDYHCYPQWSGKDLVRLKEEWVMSGRLEGTVLRYTG